MTTPNDDRPNPPRPLDDRESDVLGMLDCLLDPFFLVSAEDGTIFHCNAAALRWQGCTRSALVGQPFRALFADGDGGSREDLLAQVRVHGHVFTEQVFRLSGGRTVRADLSAAMQKWAGREWIAVHLRDAGPRIAAQSLEYQLREAAARERTIAELNHEINNPLQALLLRTATYPDAAVKKHVDEIAAVLKNLHKEQADAPDGSRVAGPGAARPDGQPGRTADIGRILIADDYDTIRRSLGMMLRGALPGVQVDLAADGEEAVALFKQRHPAVMLLDIMLPKKRGETVFEELRAFCRQERWEEPRIVFCTGYTPPETVRLAVEEPGGRHVCLLKPVPPAKLVSTVVDLVTSLENPARQTDVLKSE